MKMIKNILFEVISIALLHIFPTSPEGDEFHANKTVRLLNQTSYPAILVHSRTFSYEVKRCSARAWPSDANRW